ncbi:hypothetical protein SAMN02799624_01100 [Paenibacillus sp. UNC496MF]|uniref:hypothetical protein n=1 Tax=Paenibacillus sp. UNC496MF TaxID=1502753 RepID=UPI0008F309D8|nr:hypothetical protein [Paenibacillus sp. UNC496MF]SFI50603.1 hypothetical protein SAMN02799624_01100 [Paenibacillus sp. UNC496MF]
MERHDWITADAEAAETGRDVIGLYARTDGGAAAFGAQGGGEPAAALQDVLASLDVRWTDGTKTAAAAIRRDNALVVTARALNAVRLASAGTADLFGVTPATGAVGRLFELMQAAGCGVTDDLRARLREMRAPAVLAFGRLAAVLAQPEAPVVFEWATPAGDCRAVDADARLLREVSAYIDATETTSVFVPVRGSLTALNAAGRTFRLEGDDGRGYAGKLSAKLRRRYIRPEAALPVLPAAAEAVIERRTVYKASIDEETTVDVLTELDTDPGLDRDETLQALRELHARLDAALEQDGGYEQPSPVTADDYAELAEVAARLDASNPLKGARRELHPGDVADMRSLLAEGRPIGRLAAAEGGAHAADGDGEDGYDAGPAARAARQKAAAERQKLTVAAYADIVKLAGRLANMIGDLEREPS